MPRLWTDTIEAHRREVRDAILHTTADLVAEHGLRSVTMSQVAEVVGIGRATLYRYYPGVEEILHAWHERHLTAHLERLAVLRDEPGSAVERLERVLEAYAHAVRHQPADGYDHELAALLQRLHQGEAATAAQRRLREMIRDLIADAAASGDVRDDIDADELATFCLHALGAARDLSSEVAVRRLVVLTRAALVRSAHRREK